MVEEWHKKLALHSRDDWNHKRRYRYLVAISSSGKKRRWSSVDSKVTRITGDIATGSRGQKQPHRSTMEDWRRGEGMLAKEWDALNSVLFKQLFDRHYTLACGWCQYLLAI